MEVPEGGFGVRSRRRHFGMVRLLLGLGIRGGSGIDSAREGGVD